MRTNDEHIDDLLGKYLAGEASASEHNAVSEWLAESETNRKYFEQIRKVFDGAHAIKDRSEYNTDAAWNKVKESLHRNGGRVVDLKERSPGIQWWKIAATFLLISVIGVYLFRSKDNGIEPVQVVTTNRALSDTLPDGTDVFLNKQSKIQYAYDEVKKLHEVKLEGEAYFNVVHDKDEEFIIQAGEVLIRDIGTSFNVQAYPDSDIIEVLVEDGEVVFYTADNPGIHLKESGKGVYNKKTKQFTIDQPDANITAYKTKFFVFTETKLGEVVKSLNNVYEMPIVIDDNLKNCPITVSFRNESIDEIVAIIAETLSLNVKKEGGRYYLNGNGCE